MANEQTKITDMDIADYVRPSSITAEVLKEEGDQGILVAIKGWREGNDKETGEPYKKPVVIIEFDSGNRYDYSPGVASARAIAAKLGSTNIADWIGANLFFTPKVNGQLKWIEAAAITKK